MTLGPDRPFVIFTLSQDPGPKASAAAGTPPAPGAPTEALRLGSSRGADSVPLPGLTFLGHATVLIELGGLRILTDPILVDRLMFLTVASAPTRPSTPRSTSSSSATSIWTTSTACRSRA